MNPAERNFVRTVHVLQLRTDGPATLTKGFESNFSSPRAVGAECIDGKKKLSKRKSLARSSTPRSYSGSLWLWSFEALSRLYLSDQISAAGMIFEIWLIAQPWHFVGAEASNPTTYWWILFCCCKSSRHVHSRLEETGSLDFRCFACHASEDEENLKKKSKRLSAVR